MTKEQIIKALEKEIEFYQEGINACVEDSKITGEKALKGNELHYILGKVNTLRLLKPRLELLLDYINKHEKRTNKRVGRGI